MRALVEARERAKINHAATLCRRQARSVSLSVNELQAGELQAGELRSVVQQHQNSKEHSQAYPLCDPPGKTGSEPVRPPPATLCLGAWQI